MERQDSLIFEGTITQVRPYLQLMITFKRLGLISKDYTEFPNMIRCLIIMQEISNTYTAISVDLKQTRAIVNKHHNMLKKSHV